MWLLGSEETADGPLPEFTTSLPPTVPMTRLYQGAKSGLTFGSKFVIFTTTRVFATTVTIELV